jgi:hypothetical protein
VEQEDGKEDKDVFLLREWLSMMSMPKKIFLLVTDLFSIGMILR